MSSKSAKRRLRKRLNKDKALLAVGEAIDRSKFLDLSGRVPRPGRSKGKNKVRTIRRITSVTGRGAYEVSPYQKAMYDAQSYVPFEGNFAADYGARLGSEFAGGKGAVVGEGLQSLAKVFGYGDYAATPIRSNSLIFPDATGVPQVVNVKKGEAVVVSHKEFLGDVLTGTGTPSVFDLQSYDLNPSNRDLLPWLSQISDSFQEWELDGCLIMYKSLASNNTTSLGMGAVIMAVDYDIDNSAPTSKIEMEQLEYCMSERPASSMIMPVECARGLDVLNHLYIAPAGVVPTGKDPKFYNMGKLYVATDGCPAAATKIGEVWVSYELSLYKPILRTGASSLQAPVYHIAMSGCSGATPFGTSQTQVNNNLPMVYASNVLTFPSTVSSGTFLILRSWHGTGSGSTGITPPSFNVTNATFLMRWEGDTNDVPQAPSNGVVSTADYIDAAFIRLNSGNAAITTGTAGFIPTSSLGDVWVFAVGDPGS